MPSDTTPTPPSHDDPDGDRWFADRVDINETLACGCRNFDPQHTCAAAGLALAWRREEYANRAETLVGPQDAANADVLCAVAGERMRQWVKHPDATLDLPGLDDPARFVVLAEEVGEVARALTYDEGDPSDLARELVQVAALALAWLDGIDDREGIA